MTDEHECEYVILGYAANALHAASFPIAALARFIGEDGSFSLELRVKAVLPTTIPATRQQYLSELFQSWREAANANPDALFRELRELSTGPLRACLSGYCSIADFPRLADHAFASSAALDDLPPAGPWARIVS